jgi:hypothetical protein
VTGPRASQYRRWLENWRRALGIQGSVQAQLIDDIMPVAEVGDPTVEMAFAQGWDRHYGSQIVGAVAANYALFSLAALGSNRIIVLEGIFAAVAATFELSTQVAGGSATDTPLDGRFEAGFNTGALSSATAVASRVRGATTATAPIGASAAQLPLAVGWNPFRVVLVDQTPPIPSQNAFPGLYFSLLNVTVNQQATLGFVWRERPFDPSELDR